MMRPTPLVIGTLLVIFFSLRLSGQTTTSTPPAAGTAQRAQRLKALFDEEWQYEMLQNPEFATGLGDKRYNDRFSDPSPRAQQANLDQKQVFLSKFEAFDPSGLSAQEGLSRSLMIRNLREEIEGARFKPWEMPVNQFGGPHTGLVYLVSVTPF